MIIVYYISCHWKINGRIVAEAEPFHDNQLNEAMAFATERRKAGDIHVEISMAAPDLVGGRGVDSIVDGKTPAGEVYDWSKAGRAGKIKRSERAAWDAATAAEKDV